MITAARLPPVSAASYAVTIKTSEFHSIFIFPDGILIIADRGARASMQ
jgi:hypothetical protein